MLEGLRHVGSPWILCRHRTGAQATAGIPNRRMDIKGWTSLGMEFGGRDACSDRCGTGVAGLPADVVTLDDDDLDRARRWT